MPEEMGIDRHDPADLAGGTPEENVVQARELMAGGGRAALRDAVAVNAGAALYVCGIVDDVRSGTGTALRVLASGEVARKVDEVNALATELAERDVAAGLDNGGGG